MMLVEPARTETMDRVYFQAACLSMCVLCAMNWVI
jgi:hypothetical protein